MSTAPWGRGSCIRMAAACAYVMRALWRLASIAANFSKMYLITGLLTLFPSSNKNFYISLLSSATAVRKTPPRTSKSSFFPMSVSVSYFLLYEILDVPGLDRSYVMFDEMELALLYPFKGIKTTLGSHSCSTPVSSSSLLLLLLLLFFIACFLEFKD